VDIPYDGVDLQFLEEVKGIFFPSEGKGWKGAVRSTCGLKRGARSDSMGEGPSKESSQAFRPWPLRWCSTAASDWIASPFTGRGRSWFSPAKNPTAYWQKLYMLLDEDGKLFERIIATRLIRYLLREGLNLGTVWISGGQVNRRCNLTSPPSRSPSAEERVTIVVSLNMWISLTPSPGTKWQRPWDTIPGRRRRRSFPG